MKEFSTIKKLSHNKMSPLNYIILYCYKLFGQNKIVNQFGKSFYLKVLLPLLRTYFSLKHKNIVEIVSRNSINDNKSFNIFLSDIDTSFVIKDDTDATKLIQEFIKIKKIFIMLDFPEVYSVSEYKEYVQLINSSSWKFVDIFWNIRKINWCKIQLARDSTELNKIKMIRSIEKSFGKVFHMNKSFDQRCFAIKDFKHLDLLMDTEQKNIAICTYSDFLANNNKLGIFLELSREQYMIFNSLYPGDELTSLNNTHDTEILKSCKRSIENHERLITLSSIRLKKAKGESDLAHQNWLKLLEKGIYH